MGTIMPQSHTHGTPDARQQQLEAANIEYFDALGEDFDRRHPEAHQLAQRLVRALRRVLPLDEDATCVLDYACGSGTSQCQCHHHHHHYYYYYIHSYGPVLMGFLFF